MASERLTGDESWQELRERAIDRFNQVRTRRGEGVGKGPHGHSPASTQDLVLLGEGQFLMQMAEFERARS